MPTYEYQCRSCGAVTEVIHAMSEDGPSVCEVCGGSLRRVLFPAGIIFKGSGFYRTDSRAGASSSTSGSTTAAGTSKAEGPVADAKPAASTAPETSKTSSSSGDASG